MRVYENKYDKPCAVCGCQVPATAGYAVLDGTTWTTYCRSSLCVPKSVQQLLTGRYIDKDGRVFMPYDPNALEWLRQFPGARFVRSDERPYWQVSLLPEHRRAVLDIAGILKLDIAPELLDYTAPEDDTQRAVQAALQRGKAAGAFPYQLVGIRFIAERQRCLLGDDMGLGKTIQSLIAIPEDHGTLVVVPASVKFNWEAECRKWRPDLRPRVISTNVPVLWPPAGEVWITNPDMLPELPPDKAQRRNKLFMIEDEAHLYKNVRTQRHKAVKAWNYVADKVCIMTGTPMTNRASDLWGTLEVAGLAKMAFGSRRTFESMFELGERNELINPSPEVPRRLRQVMLRRTQSEVLKELPPSVHQQHVVSKVIPADLAEKLDALYERVEAALNMQQLPRLEEMSYVRALLATFKVAEMHELIDSYEESGVPLIVFSAHKDPVLSAAQRPGWAAITGETKPEERQRIVEAFQGGRLKGVALTIQAGGVGLTLTRAAHMLFVDLDWTPALNAQAEARIKRIGQKAERIYYTTMVVRHPVDARVLQLLEHKTKLFREAVDDVADEFKLPTTAASNQRIVGEYTPATPVALPVTETPEQLAQRLAAEAARNPRYNMRRIAETLRTQTIPELQQLIEREQRGRKEAAMRHRARASVHDWYHKLASATQSFVYRAGLNPDRLLDALAHMLRVCDGAKARDDVGFNAIDASMARHMVYLDIETNPLHAETLARLLYKYKGQLMGVVPELYEEASHAHG